MLSKPGAGEAFAFTEQRIGEEREADPEPQFKTFRIADSAQGTGELGKRIKLFKHFPLKCVMELLFDCRKLDQRLFIRAAAADRAAFPGGLT